MRPVAAKTTLEPKPVLIVVVIATALRAPSTTEKCAVPPSRGSVAPSRLKRPPYSSAARVAASEWLAASSRLKSGSSIASSTPCTPGTKLGSPRLIRSAKACLSASTWAERGRSGAIRRDATAREEGARGVAGCPRARAVPAGALPAPRWRWAAAWAAR